MEPQNDSYVQSLSELRDRISNNRYNDTIEEVRDRIVRSAGVPQSYLEGNAGSWNTYRNQYDTYRKNYNDLKKLYYENHWKVDDIEFEVEKPKTLKLKKGKGSFSLNTE